MDVVDTLRHRDLILQKELDQDGREKKLIARLREIYAAQGIKVTDEILLQGVASAGRTALPIQAAHTLFRGFAGQNLRLARALVETGCRRGLGRPGSRALLAYQIGVSCSQPRRRKHGLNRRLTDTLPGRNRSRVRCNTEHRRNRKPPINLRRLIC